MHRSSNVSTIGTIVTGDTMLLNAQSLSSTAGVLALGANVNVAGIASGSNSLLWHSPAPGIPGATTHWELIGGDLRVTKVQSNVGSVSYALRVAADNSLEIWQSTSNLAGGLPSFHRRVARFGM